MTNLDSPRQTALAGITAFKQVADKRDKLLREELDRQTRAIKVDIAQRVINALNEGVPQSRISREGLGYSHANGVRSYFSLPMSGDTVEHLRDFIRRATGGGELAAAVESTSQTTVIVDGGPGKGQGVHNWLLQRPDGSELLFRISKEFNEVYSEDMKKKTTTLTSEEEGLIIGAGLKKSWWIWLPSEERDALFYDGK